MSFCRSCRQTVLKSNLYVPLFLPSLSRSCVLRSPSHVLRLQPSFVMHEEQSPRLRSLWEGGDRSTPVPASFLFSFPVVREAESSPSLATCPCPRARPRCGVVLPPPTRGQHHRFPFVSRSLARDDRDGEPCGPEEAAVRGVRGRARGRRGRRFQRVFSAGRGGDLQPRHR